MEKRPLLTLLAAALLFVPALAGAQNAVAAKKKNLEEINSQLAEKQKELDQYKADEERIVTELAGLKKEEKQTASRRQDLEAQLARSRARSGDARQKYASLEKAKKSWPATSAASWSCCPCRGISIIRITACAIFPRTC